MQEIIKKFFENKNNLRLSSSGANSESERRLDSD